MLRSFLFHVYARRAENYRPRNPYRDRFFDGNGNHIAIPGAIPMDQRPSPVQNQLPHQDYQDFDDGSQQWDDTIDSSVTQERQARKGSRQERTLQAAVDDPAVDHPLSCISEGDSVLFDISSQCYPIYEKDSLLNSNLG